MSKRCMGCMELYDDKFDICPHCGFCEGEKAEEAIHMDPGTLLHNRYIIGRVLGYGGFGVTYLGWDGKLQIKVAIKEYLPSEFSSRIPGQTVVTVFSGEKHQQFYDGLNKFVDEAKRLAQFQNESGIVKIFDSFIENDTAYIIMEYLEGETLGARLERDKVIPEKEACEMLAPIFSSLQAVHAQGIIHRDIAPDNIFLTKNGDVKLIDFGASRYATTSHSRSLTVVVKQGYSPEEQYRSRGDQGPHTDVYALAATMYKMLTGKTPPDAMERRSRKESFNKEILVETHVANKQANISLTVENAVLNAMNIRIEDRTPDIKTFYEELTAEKPAKRRAGSIRKIDVYRWPLWLKILVPTALCAALVFGVLLITGVISFKSPYSTVVAVPEGYVEVPDVENTDHQEAIEVLSSCGLLPSVSGNIQSEYIETGKIILQDPIGGAYVLKNSTVELMLSSGKEVLSPTGDQATMPFVIGDLEADAIEKLDKAGLAYPDIEYQYSDTVKEGCVISADREYGETMEIDTKVKLVVSKGFEAFELPGVVGMDRKDAEALLYEKKLVVAYEYRNTSSEKENTVLEQSPAAGSSVRVGDTVTIVVAISQKVATVPDVKGMKIDKAKKTIEDAGFSFAAGTGSTSGVVESQSPEAGKSLIEGGTVVVTFKAEERTNSTTEATKRPDETAAPVTTAATVTTASQTQSKPADTTKKTTTERSAVKKTVKVSLNAAGGSVTSSSITAEYPGTYGSLPQPQRLGYSFSGWYTSVEGGSAVKSGSPVASSGDHTLYAHWQKKSYTLTLNPNGGSVSPNTKSVGYGDEYGVLPNPKRDYYTFKGWFTAKDGGSQVSSSTKMSAADTVIYARWEQNELSSWVLASNVPSGATVESRKWKYTQTSYTQSTKSSMAGWTVYDKKTTYGDWSGWSDNAVSQSPTLQVETRNDHRLTSYNLHWYSYTSGVNRYYTNVNPGRGYYEATTYTKEQFDAHATSIAPGQWSSGRNPGKNVASITGYAIDNGSNGVILYIDSENYTDVTQYRSRSVTTTYYYSQAEEKETDSYPTGSNISNIKEYVRYRIK